MDERLIFTRCRSFVHTAARSEQNRSLGELIEPAWAPTPAYDITLSDGPGGEHNLSINGEGRKPSTRDIMLVAEKSSIPNAEAATIVDTVRAAVSDCLTYASQAGISDRRANDIDRLLRQSD